MRIVAGNLGGRRLVAPRSLATRPTSDRVREALFAILGDVGQARVLDLYAGTGALGIEAVSRGAAHATFVEQAHEALTALRANVASVGIGDRVHILAQAVMRSVPALRKLAPGPSLAFDLLFLDPPYARIVDVPTLIAALKAAELIASEPRIVVEHATRDGAPALEGFTLQKSRPYGDTTVTFYGALG